MKTFEDTSLITIREGDFIRIKNDKRVGQLINIDLCPNGVVDKGIVAVFTIKFPNGDKYSATSNNFEPIPGELYCERIYR